MDAVLLLLGQSYQGDSPPVVLTHQEDRLRVTLVGMAKMLLGFSSMYLLEGK